MHSPTLSELPSPVSEKAGWPWTEETPRLPDRMPDGSPWPRVSIVTPSYNQGQFIEETIRSVLLQGYPNLEYIIMDGGSTDGSVEVIREYAPWLAYWVSEPDRGQAHAINKGFQRATGDILAWLNSDDRYRAGALDSAVAAFQQQPTAGLVYGRAAICDEHGKPLDVIAGQQFDLIKMLKSKNMVAQPSAFFRADVFHHIGGLNEGLHFVMDADLWLKIAQVAEVVFVDQTWSDFRYYPGSKSGRARLSFAEEYYHVVRRIFDERAMPAELHHQRNAALAHRVIRLAFEHYKLANDRQARAFALKALGQDPRLLLDAPLRGRCLRCLIGRKHALRLKSLHVTIPFLGR